MKKHILLIVAFTISFATKAQVFDQASKALQAGNAKDLAVLFSGTVEMMVNGTEGTYSKDQAEKIIADFFTKNPTSSFSISHKGSSGSGTNYAIGVLKSSNGSSFRVTLYSKDKINEIKIEKS